MKSWDFVRGCGWGVETRGIHGSQSSLCLTVFNPSIDRRSGISFDGRASSFASEMHIHREELVLPIKSLPGSD
jgi:hypothetical protein